MQEKELIALLEEIRVTAHQASHTFTREIAHNEMDADQWWLLQEALQQINGKSQSAFLLVANLRRGVTANQQQPETQRLILNEFITWYNAKPAVQKSSDGLVTVDVVNQFLKEQSGKPSSEN